MSIRLLWPFLRLVSSRLPLGSLATAIVDPDTRLPRSTVYQLLEGAIAATGDPGLGLRAAEHVEPGDLDVLEYAARGCRTLGEGYACMVRYFRLLNEADTLSLEPRGSQVAIVFRPGGPPPPPASTEYVLVGLIYFTRRNAPWVDEGAELHFTHERPPYADQYGARFAGKVVFSAAEDALIMPAERLQIRMHHANAPLAEAFERRAAELVSKLSTRESTASLVRSLVSQHLGSGKVSMHFIADELGISVPTLRRQLEADGTTFKQIVEDIRRQLAKQELARRDTSISEVAFALGFSNISAFDRAFKRWTGLAPTAYRERALSRPAPALLVQDDREAEPKS